MNDMDRSAADTTKLTRKQQAAQTKEKLLNISLQMIRQRGFDQVKITDICTEAGLSVGAFYHHLHNKAGIVVAGYAKCDEYFASTVFPRLKDRRDSEAVLDYLDYQHQYAMGFGVDLCTQIYRAQLTEGTEFFLSDERSLPAGLYALIQTLQEAGVVRREKKAQDIGRELLCISRGIIYYWCQCCGSFELRAYGRQLLSQYWAAYLVK